MCRILVFSLLLLSNTTFAQQVKQDTLKSREIETVTIIGDRAKSIPGSGEYINMQKLEKLNQPNINNVLRIIPGVNIRDEDGFGLRPNIGLRGTPVNRSAKVTLMEDGILIAPAPYADPSAYYFPTFARMQGVEVLKGSSQIKYGPYTIGGAVNLLSTSIPFSFKGFAQLTYGSYNTNQQRIWVGDSRKNFDYVFEVNRIASNGFKELDNGGNTGFDRRDVMGKLRWHTSEDAKIPQEVTLKFVNSTEDGNETYLGLTYEDFKASPLRRYSATQKDLLDMEHQHIFLSYTVLPTKGLSIANYSIAPLGPPPSSQQRPLSFQVMPTTINQPPPSLPLAIKTSDYASQGAVGGHYFGISETPALSLSSSSLDYSNYKFTSYSPLSLPPPPPPASKTKVLEHNVRSFDDNMGRMTGMEKYNKFLQRQLGEQNQQPPDFLSLSLSPPLNRRCKHMPALRGCSFVSL